ncbi:glycoside hydrolase [Ceraceosorus guamensis]|uniref:non-reducing end alpha-L-arabinofuranosidase n=1 Tax=Ceraceosorus guamensis TaxID=1522189 RepID=A0A316W5Y8_9BASI|nr:glycoside hydrolase [Ceraceosorus guamensis]PWN45289.1 glycoside hydrolase [Ceraceosorus guamensis]
MKVSLTIPLTVASVVALAAAAPNSLVNSRRATSVDLTVARQTSSKVDFGVTAFIENNINSGSDGGLYAELIKSRALQSEGDGLTNSWTGNNADISVITSDAISNVLPRSLRIAKKGSPSSFGVRNVGWAGIAAKPGKYSLTLSARCNAATSTTATAGLYDAQRKALGSAQVPLALTNSWKEFKATIQVAGGNNVASNQFGLDFPGNFASEQCQFNLISLFPETFKGTTARQDLAQLLADLKPKYWRVIGGNALEGNNLASRFQWQQAIGPLKNRPGRAGTWIDWDTDGYGLDEAHRLGEAVGAKAIPGVFAGYTLNQQSVPDDQLQPYIDSAVNELHYLLDPQGSSTWAKQREANGHAAPYNLAAVQVGNEDWISEAAIKTYQTRYPRFANAIKAAFPNLLVMSSSPYPTPKTQLAAIDQHDYNTPNFFLGAYDRYDTWARNATTIWNLEMAVTNSGKCGETPQIDALSGPCRLTYPIQLGAVAEFTAMMGMERNSDVVKTFAYAPLLNKIGNGLSQWHPDLISFDAVDSWPSASYWAQYAFGQYGIDSLYKITSSVAYKPVYWSAGKQGNLDVIKLSNSGADPVTVTVKADGAQYNPNAAGSLILSAHNDAYASNTPENRQNIKPTRRNTSAKDFVNGAFRITLPAYSLAAVKLARA